LVDPLRQDISKVDDPKAKALFETSAEVLRGLAKAFNDLTIGFYGVIRRYLCLKKLAYNNAATFPKNLPASRSTKNFF